MSFPRSWESSAPVWIPACAGMTDYHDDEVLIERWCILMDQISTPSEPDDVQTPVCPASTIPVNSTIVRTTQSAQKDQAESIRCRPDCDRSSSSDLTRNPGVGSVRERCRTSALPLPEIYISGWRILRSWCSVTPCFRVPSRSRFCRTDEENEFPDVTKHFGRAWQSSGFSFLLRIVVFRYR